MDMTSRMTSHFRDAMATYEQSMNVLAEPLAIAVDVLFGALANNGKILACGNGGSAADAQHFIAELVGRFERERLPLAGIALNTDTSILTAVGNDYGFDEVFERQVNAFGQAGDVVAEYGHVHDIAEAATLLDPDTKAILKSALAEMWQAELHLRQGNPDLALPYEYRALEFVKQVQQSTRIYLARVGLELPPPDETRRLSGERKDLVDRVGSLTAAADDERTIAQLWQALADGGTPDWAAATSWLRANQARTPDALGVLAALDAAQRDPACADCRARLRDLLWPLLPTPAAATAPRAAPDAAGRAYLEALREAAKGAG